MTEPVPNPPVTGQRRLIWLLTGALVLALAGLAWCWVLLRHERAEREEEWQAQRVIVEMRVLGGETQARLFEEQGQLPEALAAARLARAFAVDDRVSPETKTRAAELLAGLERQVALAEADRQLLARLLDTRRPATADTEADLTQAFRKWGIEPGTTEVLVAAERLRSRPDEFRANVTAALDEWAAERRKAGGPGIDWHWLAALAKAIDPDPYQDKPRNLLKASGAP
jgi:hypothetical protein